MVAPTTHFIQFSTTGPNPSGFRHIGASGLKVLDTSPSGELDFGIVNNGSGVVVTSATRCVVWVVDAMGDAQEQIFDMRLWLSSVTDFVGRGTDYNTWFNQKATKTWNSGIKIDKDAPGTYTPVALPSSQNLLSTSGVSNILSGGHDYDCSEYIYLSSSVDSKTPVGVYGGPGVGGFRYRITYKYI